MNSKSCIKCASKTRHKRRKRVSNALSDGRGLATPVSLNPTLWHTLCIVLRKDWQVWYYNYIGKSSTYILAQSGPIFTNTAKLLWAECKYLDFALDVDK